jgi:hypothetical protein
LESWKLHAVCVFLSDLSDQGNPLSAGEGPDLEDTYPDLGSSGDDSNGEIESLSSNTSADFDSDDGVMMEMSYDLAHQA